MNLFRESLHTVTAQLLCLLFGIGTSVVLNRTLGPSGKGEFVSYLFISQLVICCINLGLAVSASYFMGKGKYREGDIVSSNLFASFVLGGIGIFFGFLLFNLYEDISPLLRWLVLLTIIPGLWLLYVPDFFLGKDRIILHNNFNLLWQIARFAIIAFSLYFFSNKLTASLGSILVLHLVFAIFSFPFLLRAVKRIGRVNFSYLKEGVNFGYKVFFVDLLAFLNYRFDILFLRLFRGVEEIGYYSTAVYMVEVLWLIPRAVSLVLYSKFVTNRIDEKDTYNAISITLWIVTLVGIISIFIVKPVITILYTERFLPAYLPYLVLLPGVVALVLPKLLISEITGAWGKPEIVLWGMMLTVAVNVILNLLTIPKYGMMGAAFSSTFAYILEAIFFIWIYKKFGQKSLKRMFFMGFKGIKNLLLYEKFRK